MKKSFLNATSPFVTEMVQVSTATRAENDIRNAVNNGATAIGLQLSYLEKQYRDKETLTRIISASEDKPVYFTNYRNAFNVGDTDEELLDGLLFGLDCGATLVDVMGDTFDPSPEELTTDKKAIEKQMAFIDKVHERGGEVLMSSHVYQFRPAERVLEIALEQQRRGADIVKIVTGSNGVDDELKNLEICALLKKELKVPFLFLAAGEKTSLIRNLGPSFGACMWLCFSKYDETTYPGPPLLKNVLKIKEGLKL